MAMKMFIDPLVFACAFAGLPDGDADKLQGRWELVPVAILRDVTHAGAGYLRWIKFALVFKDGKYSAETRCDGVLEKAEMTAIRMDSTRNPTEIDLPFSEGEPIGNQRECIYSIDRDELTICVGIDGERPEEFDTGPTKVNLVFRREKEAE